MTDEKIKPVAWCLVYNGPPTNTDIHSDPTMNEYRAMAMAKLAAPSVRVAKLYPESALAQAREEGRLAGLREAAEMVEMTDLSKVADPSWKLFFADMFIQIAANIRAAEGKK
jgi:hypothetical protein